LQEVNATGTATLTGPFDQRSERIDVPNVPPRRDRARGLAGGTGKNLRKSPGTKLEKRRLPRDLAQRESNFAFNRQTLIGGEFSSALSGIYIPRRRL